MAKDLDFTFKAAPAFRKSSREEEALQHLIDAWNSKNAKAAKRVGTFGFMAAALTACGGSGSITSDTSQEVLSTFRLLSGDPNNLVTQGLNVTLGSAKDDLLSITDLIGSPDAAINASAGLVVPSGQTYIGDILLFDIDSGGISASGDGSLWLLAPASGFDANTGEQIVKLDVDLNGGTLTFDLESDNLTVRIDDQSSVDLNGGTLRISDGDVAVSAATYASWNVGNLIVNSRLVIDLRNTTLSDEDIGKVLTELDAATDAGNTESSLRLLIDDVEQTELVFNALQANTGLNSDTAPKVEVENTAGDISIVDLEALIDSKIAFMAKSLERKIDALELDVTGDTANLDTDVTLKTLVDLSNTLAELQAATSGEGGLEERLAAAEGKLAGITDTVITEITSAVNGLQQQIEGEGYSDATLKTLAELSAAISDLQALAGLSELGANGQDAQTLVARLNALETTTSTAIQTYVSEQLDLLEVGLSGFTRDSEGDLVIGADDYATLKALSDAINDLQALAGLDELGASGQNAQTLVARLNALETTTSTAIQTYVSEQLDLLEVGLSGFTRDSEGDLVIGADDYATLKALSDAINDLQALAGLDELGASGQNAQTLVARLNALETTTSTAIQTYVSEQLDLLEVGLSGFTRDSEGDLVIGADDYATLKALSDAINDLQALAGLDELGANGQDAQTLVARLSDAETKLSGIASTVTAEISTAVNGLQQQIEGEGFDTATLKTLAELSGAIETLRGDDLTEGSIEFIISEVLGDEPTFDSTAGRFVVLGLGEDQTVGNALAELMNMALDYTDSAIDGLELQVTGDTVNLDAGVTLQTLVDLSNALAALEATASGAGGDLSALQAVVGAPASTDGEGNTIEASGLYGRIDTAVSTAVTGLEGQITDLESKITGGTITQTDYDTLFEISNALATLTGAADGSVSKSISDAIGAPSTETSAAKGLFIQVESLIATAVSDLQGQIDAINGEGDLVANLSTLVELGKAVKGLQDVTSGEGGVTDTLAGLESQIKSIIDTDIVGLQAQIDAIEDNTDGENAATLDSIAGLKAAVQELQAAALGEGGISGINEALADLQQSLAGLDIAPPTVVDITLTASGGDSQGVLNAGDIVTATVAFNEAVLVTGSPTLQLDIGGQLVEAALAGGAGTEKLSFTYTIATGDSDGDGISVPADALQLNGTATIRDSAGNNAVLASTATADTSMTVDNSPLALSMSAGELFGADAVAVGVVFLAESSGESSEGVYLSDLNPDGTYTVPQGRSFIDIDVYFTELASESPSEPSALAQAIAGPATVDIDLGNKVLWTDFVESVVVSESTLREVLSTSDFPPLQGVTIDEYIAQSTIPAGTLSLNGTMEAGETIADDVLAQISGHDPADVSLTVTSPLTVAQANALVEYGFAVENMTYSIRDYDTTVQGTLVNPATADILRGAEQVTAIGDELDNEAMRFTSFDQRVNLRIEGLEGDDQIDAGRGDDEIVGGLGADVIELTYRDNSDDTVVYQTIYDGETLPITALTFSNDADNYREGSVLTVQVNGTAYQYTTVDGDTIATALQGFATAIEAAADVGGVVVKDNVLEIIGATSATKLTVVTDSGAGDTPIFDISNPGQKTRWTVEFSDDASTYPDNQSAGGTFEFDRKVYVTIDEKEISADIVYTSPGVADPVGTVAALKTAIEAEMAGGKPLAEVLGAVTIESNGTADVRLVLEGKTAPLMDTGAPTFSVTNAKVDAAGTQQQTTIEFSSNDADYYEGGTLSVDIDGEIVTADMHAGDASASIAALKAEIDLQTNGGQRFVGGGVETTGYIQFSSDVDENTAFNTTEDSSYSSYSVSITIGDVVYVHTQFVSAGRTNDVSTVTPEKQTTIGGLVAELNDKFAGVATFTLDAENNRIAFTTDGGNVVHGYTTTQSPGISFFPAGVTNDDDPNEVKVTTTAEITAGVSDYIDVPKNDVLANLLETAEQSVASITNTEAVQVVDGTSNGLTTATYSVGEDRTFFIADDVSSTLFGRPGAYYRIDSSLDRITGEFIPEAPRAPATVGYVKFNSFNEFINSLKLNGTGQSIFVEYDLEYANGNLVFSQKDGGPALAARDLYLDFGTPTYVTDITLTAATEEPDPLSATGTLSYEGEYQQATISLEDAATYGVSSDGTDIPTDREVDVYYEGGKAWVEITPEGAAPIAISADMVEDFLSYSGYTKANQFASADSTLSSAGVSSAYMNVAGSTYTMGADETIQGFLDRVSLSEPKIVLLQFDEQSKEINIAASEIISMDFGAGTDGFIVVANYWDPKSGGTLTSQNLADAIQAEIDGSETPGEAAQVFIEIPAGQNLTGDYFRYTLQIEDAELETSYYIRLKGTFSSASNQISNVYFYFSSAGGSSSYSASVSDTAADNVYTAQDFVGLFTGSFLADRGITMSYLNDDKGNADTSDDVDKIIFTASKASSGVSLSLATDWDDGDAISDSIMGQGSSFGVYDITSVGTDGIATPGALDGIIDSVSADATTGEITLTAAAPGKQTFEVSDVRLDYQGVKQIATISLEDAASYDNHSDGTDVSATGRGADVYYEGGKVYATITGAGADGNIRTADDVVHTISAEMAPNQPATVTLTNFVNSVQSNAGSYIFSGSVSGESISIYGNTGSALYSAQDIIDALTTNLSGKATVTVDGNDVVIATLEVGSNAGLNISGIVSGPILPPDPITNVPPDNTIYSAFGMATGVSGATVTTQNLVDAINEQINGVEGTPAVVTLDANLAPGATLDKFASGSIAFGFKTSADESGFNWYQFSVRNPTGSSYYVMNLTGAELVGGKKYADEVTYDGFINYLNTIDGTGVDDRFSAEINAEGDIVFTSTATGSDAYLEVALRYAYDGGFNGDSTVLDFGTFVDTVDVSGHPVIDLVGSTQSADRMLSGLSDTGDGDASTAADPGLSALLESAAIGENGEITLTAKNPGNQTFEVSDVRLDYQGVKQIATVDFTAFDDEDATPTSFYTDGKLAVSIQETDDQGEGIGNPIEIEATMADGATDGDGDPDLEGSLAALVDAIEAAINPAPTVAVGTEIALNDIVHEVDANRSPNGYFELSFFYDADGNLATSGDYQSFRAYLSGRTGLSSVAQYGVSNLQGYKDSKWVQREPNQSFELGNFLDWLNAATVGGEPLPVSFSVSESKLVMTARETGSGMVGLKIMSDTLNNVGIASDNGDHITGIASGGLGFLGSVSESDGVITLTSADNVTQQFKVTAATISDPAKPETTTVTFSSTDADYFAIGSDTNGTAGEVSVTVQGNTYTVTMKDTMADTMNDLLAAIENGQGEGEGAVPALTGATVSLDGSVLTFTGDQVGVSLSAISASASVDAIQQVTVIDLSGVDELGIIGGIGRNLSVEISTKTFSVDGGTRLELLQNLKAAIDSEITDDLDFGALLDTSGVVVDEDALTLTLTARYGGSSPFSVSTPTMPAVDDGDEGTVAQELSIGFTGQYLDSLLPGGKALTFQLGKTDVEVVITGGQGATRDTVLDEIAAALNGEQQIATATKGVLQNVVLTAAYPGENVLGTVSSGQDNTVKLFEGAAEPKTPITTGFFAEETKAGSVVFLENPEDTGTTTITTPGANVVPEDATVETTQAAKAETTETVSITNAGTGEGDDSSFFGDAALTGFVDLVSGELQQAEITLGRSVRDTTPLNTTVKETFNAIVRVKIGDVEYEKGYFANPETESFEGQPTFATFGALLSDLNLAFQGVAKFELAADFSNKVIITTLQSNSIAGVPSTDPRHDNPVIDFADILEGSATPQLSTYATPTSIGEGSFGSGLFNNTGVQQTFTNPDSSYTATDSSPQSNLEGDGTGDATYAGDDASIGAIDGEGNFNGQGVKQTYTNPDDGYTGLDASPQLDGEDSGEGDTTLFGSDPGVYDDDGLLTTWLSGETPTAADVDGEGTNRYTSDGEGDLTAIIDVDATVSEGADASTSDLGENDIVNDRSGFAGFDWDEGSTSVLSLGNDAPDVIYNFQTGEGGDVISLEAGLAVSTYYDVISGTLGRIASSTLETRTVAVEPGSDMRPAPEWFSPPTLTTPYSLTIDLGIASSDTPFSIYQGGSSRIQFFVTDPTTGYAQYTRVWYDFPSEATSFNSVAEFVQYLEDTREIGGSGTTAPDLEWSFAEGVLTLSMPTTSGDGFWLSSESFSDASMSALVISYEPFNLSEMEFGLITSDENVDQGSFAVTSAELDNVDKTAALLDSLFDFSSTSDNSSLNTTLFAVTASDDDSVTAIWAHQQSSAGDSTVEALELYHLATVNTIGGEFELSNFDILNAPQVV